MTRRDRDELKRRAKRLRDHAEEVTRNLESIDMDLACRLLGIAQSADALAWSIFQKIELADAGDEP